MQVAKKPKGLNGTRVNAKFLLTCSSSESFEEAKKAVKSSEVSEFWWLILLSIAVTRRNKDWLQELAAVPVKGVSESQLVDGLFVTFMFNLINEVANSYLLQPEWNVMQWSGIFRKKILQTTLPSFVRIDPISREKEKTLSTNLPKSLAQLELPIESEIDGNNLFDRKVWHCFNANSRIAISIQQILFAFALIHNHEEFSNVNCNFKDIFSAAVIQAVHKLGTGDIDSIWEIVNQQSE